jgi:hypothetical protein
MSCEGSATVKLPFSLCSESSLIKAKETRIVSKGLINPLQFQQGMHSGSGYA